MIQHKLFHREIFRQSGLSAFAGKGFALLFGLCGVVMDTMSTHDLVDTHCTAGKELQHKLQTGKMSNSGSPSQMLKEIAGSPNSSDLKKIMPAEYARRYRVIPLWFKNNCLHIATAEPDNFALLDELRWVVGQKSVPEKADATEMDEALRFMYGLGAETVRLRLDQSDGNSFMDLNPSATSDVVK